MPPKSASKKDKPQYFQDEDTKLLIFNQNQEDFKKQGEFSYFDPVKKIFHPTKSESRFALNIEDKLPHPYKRDLLFINHQVMQLLDLTAAGRVVIELKNVKDESLVGTFSKRCWPIEDRALDTIRMVDDEMWRLKLSSDSPSKEDVKIFIRKLSDCIPAVEMIIRCNDFEEFTLEQRKHVMALLRKECHEHAFHQSEQIRLKFLQQILFFQIHRLVGRETDLSGALNRLTINTEPKFYLIDKQTSVELDSGDTDCDFLSKPIFFGGLKQQEQELLEVISTAKNRNSTSSKRFGLTKGILLHGASGCGKTVLVRSILKQAHVRYFELNGGELFSRYYGETESKLIAVFNKVRACHPDFTIIVVEDIHNLCPKGDNTDLIRRVTSTFIDQVDKLNTINTLIIATTNQIDDLSPVIRRSGRLDYEIEVPVPNPSNRASIIKVLLEKHEIVAGFSQQEIHELATVTHGYTGADLEALITKAFYTSRSSNEIKLVDVLANLTVIKPSAMREVQIESPNVHWTDIGGQKDLKLKLQQAIEWPIKHPETFQRLGITPPRGLLMFGPPGCSKTMIAKALATESGVNFLSIKGSELFSMWVGESEKAVRKLFQKAREVAPAIIFFDEIDAIGGERFGELGGGGGGSSVKERVLAQILTEIDGVHVLKDVTIVAATNRPDLIDKALMRPGRLDRIIYVGLPDADTRREIFKIKLSKMPVAPEVSIDILVELTEGYSGAEIQAVCQEAALHALETSFDVEFVGIEDFEAALAFVQPRTSNELLQLYKDYLEKNRFK